MMKTLCFIIVLLLSVPAIISCNNEMKQEESTKVEVKNNLPDYGIALEFITQYISQNPDAEGIKNNKLLSENFKTSYFNLIDSARKADPELGLGFDPIIDAQDTPENGFEIAAIDSASGFVTLSAKGNPEYQLIVKVILSNSKSLVEGSGVINIPSIKRKKTKLIDSERL